MRDRSLAAATPLPPVKPAAGRRPAVTVDVVLLTPHGKQLAVLLARGGDGRARDRWTLPFEPTRPAESLVEGAARIADAALRSSPSWMEQIAAYSDERHPAESEISVGFVALVPTGTPSPVGGDAAWFPVSDLPALAPRQRAMLEGALTLVRARLDHSPIAFRLLPPHFTLSELQETYELLLGRKLHKASFRRALHASWLVEPTDEWRSEGRGRPAQLFRFAPKKRRASRRGVRFDLIV